MTERPDGFTFDPSRARERLPEVRGQWEASTPFKRAVVDNFLAEDDVRLLSETFPSPDHPVWLDWRRRSAAQYGKQGPGDSAKFELLDWRLRHALMEFNSDRFLAFIEGVTSIPGLLPDPYFTGGGLHQILHGGILDIHTDFNYYGRLNIYRRLNVLLYLTEDWAPSYGGSLEFWDGPPNSGGERIASIAPIRNRLVIFATDKTTFHGHPQEWCAPPGIYRRSVALYYYTAAAVAGQIYDTSTDFQGYVAKDLPT